MFYKKLEQMCAKRGMSVARFAQELGLSNSTATKWRQGAKPYYNTMSKIATFFDVEIEYLLDDDYMDYDEWLLEVKHMTRAVVLKSAADLQNTEKTVTNDGLDEEFMVLARKLSAPQMQRVKDFMRGILA